MSNKIINPTVLTIRGIDILIKNNDVVTVFKNNQQCDVHRDEILLNDDSFMFAVPCYTVKIIASFRTKPVDIIDGDQYTAALQSKEKIDMFRACLRKMSTLPTAEKLPFSIEPLEKNMNPVLHQGALDNGSMVIAFRGFEHVYQSVDALYLDEDISQTLFSLSIYNIYRQMKYIAEALPKKFPDLIVSGEVQILRKISPEQVDEYISEDVQNKVREGNFFFQDNVEKNGFWIKLESQNIDDYFGGVRDTQEFISAIWKQFALGESSSKV